MMNVLAAATVFKGLPREALLRLAEHGKSRTFPAGSHLMLQGEQGDSLHVILRGQVRVQRSHPDLREPLVLARLGPGEVVGEMAVLDRGPRSATVTAIRDTETMELDRAAFANAVVSYPEVLMALLGLLTERLRDTDELAAQLSQKVLHSGKSPNGGSHHGKRPNGQGHNRNGSVEVRAPSFRSLS